MSRHNDRNLVENRRREVEQQKKTRILLAIITASLLLLLLVGAVVRNKFHHEDDNESRRIHSASKSVEMICATTDYTHACEKSLLDAVKTEPDDPKVLIKAAVTVVLDELSDAFDHSKLLQSNDREVQGAVEDCRLMYEDAKDEINATLRTIVHNGIENLPERSQDLRTWLSAVLAYQQTCIDGFPDGELKTEMRKNMRRSQELTSNALAIIQESANFLVLLNPGDLVLSTHEIAPATDSSPGRKASSPEASPNTQFVSSPSVLPSDVPAGAPSPGGFPSWMFEDGRQGLKNHTVTKLPPNATIARDGSGNFTTFSEALRQIPAEYEGRYVIYVKEGIYEEQVNITSKMPNVTLYGDGSTKSIVTGNLNYVDGTRTYHTATFIAKGAGFIAIGMGFRNTAGAEKHQAVALRVNSDRSVFLNCRVEGYQDTLYAHSNRQFYRGCVISGTVDFIFGDAAAVFQSCEVVSRRPPSHQATVATAQGRSDHRENTGFVFQNCRFTADPLLADPSRPAVQSYLARPWKEFSTTVFMESEIDGFIHPDGYMPWNGTFALDTLFYAEYDNFGGGANTSSRVRWGGVHDIGKEEAEQYTVERFIDGGAWIRESGAPVRLGLASAGAPVS